MKRVRVLLVDDQLLFREGLATLLSVRPEVEVVGEAANGLEALERVAALRPHVVLMDLRMPVLNGVEATRRLRAAYPDVRVVALTTFDDDEDIFEALRAGALGYLLKDVSADRLLEAIRAAARGESFLQPSIASKVVAEFTRLAETQTPTPITESPVEELSEREVQVLRLLASGASNKEIGVALNLAEGTVKNHITNILGKLGVRDRTQAALQAKAHGII
jgi:DNA-binding NarL/FixJ family response regulator